MRSGALIGSLLLPMLVVLAFSPRAHGQAPDGDQEAEVRATAMARSLFAQGVELMAEERYEAAATHFERSLELRESAVVHYNLASALVQLERFVEAVEHLERVLSNAEAPPRARAAAEQLLREAEPRVGYLTLDIRGDATGIAIALDDRALPNAAVGVAVPVDPGARTVVVRRGEEIVAQGVAEVSEGRTAVLALEVPPPPAIAPPPNPLSFSPGSTLLEDLPEGEPETDATEVPDPAEVARRDDARQRRDAARTETSSDDSMLTNPWFWTGVGAGVVVAVVVATVVALIVVSEPAKGINGTLEPSIVELGR